MRFKRLVPETRRKVNALIRKQCCNFDNGNCILLDDGEPCVCPQTITYSLICKWFKSAVLPTDKELYIKLMKPENTNRCAVCGKEFVKKTNNAKYCDNCRVVVRRRKIAEYKRKCVRKSNHSEP